MVGILNIFYDFILNILCFCTVRLQVGKSVMLPNPRYHHTEKGTTMTVRGVNTEGCVIFTCPLLKIPFLPHLFPGIILSLAFLLLSRCGCVEVACLTFHALELGISTGSMSRIKSRLEPA